MPSILKIVFTYFVIFVCTGWEGKSGPYDSVWLDTDVSLTLSFSYMTVIFIFKPTDFSIFMCYFPFFGVGFVFAFVLFSLKIFFSFITWSQLYLENIFEYSVTDAVLKAGLTNIGMTSLLLLWFRLERPKN